MSLLVEPFVSNLFSIKGKVALITGGSRGIGLMIAQGFVEAGARVYLCARKAKPCEEAARVLSARGFCEALPADLASTEGCLALVASLREREPQLDILVNNAGAAWGGPLASYEEEGWDKVLDLNLKSLFFLSRELVELLALSASPSDPARIINIGSIDGIRVPKEAETYAYSASKAAVHQMTRVLAYQLGQRQITVNAIAPGPFPSRMTAALLEAHGEQIVKDCPLGRLGQPEDMAGIAIFLASRAGAYLTGTVIPVDGGLSLL